MTFATAWTNGNTGDYFAVTNGIAEPSVVEGIPHKSWRSQNFIGKLIDKTDGEYRSLLLELPARNGVQVSYRVNETQGLTFTASDLSAYTNQTLYY